MHSWCCPAQEPSLIADPAVFIELLVSTVLQRAVAVENAVAGQQALLQQVKDSPESV